ncbi:MAG: hypothetical protein ACKVUT_17775 [Gaiella sp.]
MALYDRVRDLRLAVESYTLEPLQLETPSFTRQTTVVRLAGGGETGSGEDVTYNGELHDVFRAAGSVHALAGEWSLDSFSRHLGTLPLFPGDLDQPAYLDYRRWAFESAALDLALRQNGLSLGDAVGRRPRPLIFVASGGLGDPPTTARLRRLLELYPTLRFKLDARPSWDEPLIAELAALGCLDSVDFKGQYHGTTVDNPADVGLYRRVLTGLPEAWLEDPDLTPEVIELLEPVSHRVTWDANIHSVEDIEALPWVPRTVNVKPSRFGTVERLFATYDHLEAHGIAGYGGGQYELSVGRDQIQLLAALFHPETPNDVAPGGYNATEPAAGLPSSPLAVTPRATGFALTGSA